MSILNRLAESAQLGQVGRFSPRALRLWSDGWAGRVIRFLYRPRLQGWENLPEGPFLLVANHSGGGGVDVAGLATLWAQKPESERRPLTAMAHPLVFHLPLFGTLLREFGAIPSSYAPALRALQEGLPVLIFPGGDHEAFRPIWQANRVDFNGRQGFLRLAREAWVPIVPLGIHGTHYTVPILWRSKLLAWLLVWPRLAGNKRVPLTVMAVLGVILFLGLGQAAVLSWPVAGVLAFLWLGSPLNVLLGQVPYPMRARIGAPLPPEKLFGDDRQRPLTEAYADVVGAIQAQLDSARG